jgi:magnesium transporter
MQKMGGMEALDEPYLTTPLLRLVRHRGVWLSVLFLGEMLTASALSHFEDKLKVAYVLAMFLPLIISSGGNCGSQASTLIIRAMAINEVSIRQWWTVVRREIICGALLGLLLGSLGIIRIMLWQMLGWADYSQHERFASYMVALTVGVAIFGVVTWGSLMGGVLPIVIRRVGLDPATISAPFIATLVDVSGLVIYFNAAIFLLGLQ